MIKEKLRFNIYNWIQSLYPPTIFVAETRERDKWINKERRDREREREMNKQRKKRERCIYENKRETYTRKKWREKGKRKSNFIICLG